MRSWVYILKCADGSYYVGKTDATVEQRVAQHNGGFGSAFTKSRRPVLLVWAEGFSRYDDACAVERQLKGWRREKKEALIRGQTDLLPALARSRAM
ncbi:MAG: GIY-YIG nuclease family protein [Reyranellaceae bacterium]